ncbi:MAG: glycosyltransferase family 4 protein, partial [Clostridiales bacterium]|nr:glycosyltransferase family 4 protein [Clostridiales bacterium]
DIPKLLRLSDIVVASSRREGLPVNVMEAMATGLPLVVTKTRGHIDLVKHGINGFVVGIDDIKGFANAINKLYKFETLRENFGKKNLELIKEYSIENVIEQMKEIYRLYI